MNIFPMLMNGQDSLLKSQNFLLNRFFFSLQILEILDLKVLLKGRYGESNIYIYFFKWDKISQQYMLCSTLAALARLIPKHFPEVL